MTRPRKRDCGHECDFHAEQRLEELCGARRDTESRLHHRILPLERSHIALGDLDGQIWATTSETHWQVWQPVCHFQHITVFNLEKVCDKYAQRNCSTLLVPQLISIWRQCTGWIVDVQNRGHWRWSCRKKRGRPQRRFMDAVKMGWGGGRWSSWKKSSVYALPFSLFLIFVKSLWKL